MPAPAANVGFNTNALNADFTQAPNTATGINCNFNNRASTWFFQGNTGRPQRTDLSCPQNAFLTTDGEQQVLDLRLLESQIITHPCPQLGGGTECNGLDISTRSASGPGNTGFAFTDYPMGYYEYTYRVSAPGGIPGLYGLSLWSWSELADKRLLKIGSSGRQDVLEIDFEERHLQGSTTANSDLGIGDWSSSGPAFDFIFGPTDDTGVYHKVAGLFYGNPTIMHFCLYVDDVQAGCQDYIPKGDQATQRRYIMVAAGPKCNQTDGDASCFVPGWGNIDLLLQSVRVWTCGSWKNTMCYTQ